MLATAANPEREVEYQLRLVVLFGLWGARYLLDAKGLGMLPLLALVGLAVLMLLYRLRVPRSSLKTVVGLSLLLLMGIVVAFLFFHDPVSPFRGAIRYAAYGASFYIAYEWRLKFGHLAAFFLLLVAFEFSLALLQMRARVDRPKGTLINSNHISYLLVVVAGLMMAYYKSILGFVLVAGAAFILGGLGGSVSVLVVFVLYVFFFGSKLQKRLALIILPIVLVVGAVLLAGRLQEQESGVTQLAARLQSNSAGGAGSLVWRIVTWRNGIVDILDSDAILTGKGLEYASKASPYFPEYFTEETHNDYVRVFMETGLIGLLIYGALYLGAIRFFWSRGTVTRRREAIFFAIVLVGLGAGQVVGNIVTQSTLWWVFFGLMGAYVRHEIEYPLRRSEE